MKKIRNINDLEFEKLRLRVRQLELEKQMERSWKKITRKLSLNGEPASEPAQKNVQLKPASPLVNGILGYGASFLSHRLGMLAGKKIEALAENALEKLSGKINAAVSKKKKA